jgi:hypothetical protein
MIDRKRLGFEFKYKDAPVRTQSMTAAMYAFDSLLVAFRAKII